MTITVTDKTLPSGFRCSFMSLGLFYIYQRKKKKEFHTNFWKLEYSRQVVENKPKTQTQDGLTAILTLSLSLHPFELFS